MSNSIIDELHQHVFESDLARYNFGSGKPVPVILFARTPKSGAPILYQANAYISQKDDIYMFKLDITKRDMKRLGFPQESGFSLIVNDVIYTSTRVRYLTGKKHIVFIDAVLNSEN